MEFKFRVGHKYNFSDVRGTYVYLGMDGNANNKYTCAVFVEEGQKTRRRIKVKDAKELINHESNAEL